MENPTKKQLRIRRDKEILKLYPALTLEEIGERYILSKEAVRQIIKKGSDILNKNKKVAAPERSSGKVKK